MNAKLKLNLDRLTGTFDVDPSSSRIYSRDAAIDLVVHGFEEDEVVPANANDVTPPGKPVVQFVNSTGRVVAQAMLAQPTGDGAGGAGVDGRYDLVATLSTNTVEMRREFFGAGPQAVREFTVRILDTETANPLACGLFPVWNFPGVCGGAPTELPSASEVLAELRQMIEEHAGRTNNPHAVTAALISALTQKDGDARYALKASATTLSGQVAQAVQQSAAAVAAMRQHTSRSDNPHGVTAAQVRLGNVDNTCDLDKPVSHPQRRALDEKQNNLSNVQLAAVNSGIDARKVAKIAQNESAISAEVDRATAAEEKNAAAIDETGKALVAETERAKTAEQNLASEVSEVGDKVDTLVAGDVKKSARSIAAEEVAKVVANAPQDLDTLKEIAAYIESDKTNAAQMVANIDSNTKSISAEVKRAQEAETALAGRVKTLEEQPSLDDSVTKQSANGVKSSGIWSAVWGALAALPSGFTSLYDWCVSQLDGKLDKSGGTLTGGLAFEGEQFGIKFTDSRQTISFSNENNISQYGLLIQGKAINYPSAPGTLALTSDISNVRYPLGAPITASAILADRTMNRVNALSTLTDPIDLTFPDLVTGMCRDFLVRVHRETGGVAINFTVPTGAVVFGDGFASAIGEGEDWLYAITETDANEWYVRAIKLEVAE